MGALSAAERAGSEDTRSDTVTPLNAPKKLFNGRDLSGWSTWQRVPDRRTEVPGMARDTKGNYLEPIGADHDPLRVFSVQQVDGAPVVRVSGEVFGFLVTDAEYADYHFSIQYKWGDAKYVPRLKARRDSGILFHAFGSPGAWGDTWMESLECQIIEGGTGDFIAVGHVMADVAAELPVGAKYPVFSPGADQRVFRRGAARCETPHELELVHGKWNQVDLYTLGADSVFVINGTVAMRVRNARHESGGAPLTKGRIQLQSEGAEIFFRNALIAPISALPQNL